MITTTTPNIEGRAIEQYLGIVSSEVIIGANVIKDIFAGLRDFFGGRSATYERVLDEARSKAMAELVQRAQTMGANAVVGIDLDFETIGANGSMLMVIASGTAVRVRLDALLAKSRLLAEAGEPVACHWTKTFFHQSETFFESDEPQL